MKKLQSPLMLFLIAAITFGSCKKEGPQGPKDTANVIYSDWIKIPAAAWAGLGSNLAIADIAAPRIREDNADKVTVMVYMKSADYTIALPATTPQRAILFGFIAGNIRLQISTFNNIAVTAESVVNIWWRYVVIPGKMTARIGAPAPDLKDYHAVCRYYAVPVR